MNCYRHHEAYAVGICKNCSKGICTECAVDVGNGIACKNECEEEVKNINELIAKNKGAFKRTGGAYYRNSFIYGSLGVFFVLFGMFIEKPMANFTLPVGLIFLVGMVLNINSALKLKNK